MNHPIDNADLQRAFAAATGRRACETCKGAGVLPDRSQCWACCLAAVHASSPPAAPQPATIVPCSSCAGEGQRNTREQMSGGYVLITRDDCEQCSGSGRDVVGQLPEPSEAAARLGAFVQAEMQCNASDVPACALDLMTLCAATLRAAEAERDARDAETQAMALHADELREALETERQRVEMLMSQRRAG